MERKRWILLLLILLVMLISVPVYADVGGGVDFDSHGFGGGSSSSSSSSNSGEGAAWLIFFLLRSGPLGLGALAVIAAIFIFSMLKTSGSGHGRPSPQYDIGPSAAVRSMSQEQLNQLLTRDPNFSKEDFLARAGDVFITLQNAWTAKDWRSIRAFETNQLFHQHEKQLEQFIQNGQTDVVEDISVLSTELEEYTEDAQHQYLKVILTARYRDYIVDDATQRVVKGDKNRRYLMTYRMTFLRKLDATTEFKESASATSCPNCGANLSINQNGICEYCGSEVTTGAMQWVLNTLQPVSQRTL